MRISSLEFEGFGPYKEAQFIDFDQLGESGLFLINGPTGAGKSTIIDAICFALYGKLASDEADSGRMRSDFCGPRDRTRVELVFESAAGRFRVERNPEYMRSKSRGNGETREHAECKLHRILPGGGEETIAYQVASANRELAERVGLTRDQFVQTVVLPQGKFAQFLNADTKDRELILKSIFRTELFERVADTLKLRAIESAKKRDDITREIEWAVRGVGDLRDASEEDLTLCLEFARTLLDDQLREVVSGWRLHLMDSNDLAQTASEEARASFHQADQIRDLARGEHEAFVAASEAVSELQSAEESLKGARIDCTTGVALVVGTTIAIDNSTDISLWRTRIKEAADIAHELRALLEEEKKVSAWPAEVARRTDEICSLREQANGLEERQRELPGLIAEQEEARRASPAAQETMEFERESQSLDTREEIRCKRDQLVSTRADLQSAIDRASKAAELAAQEAERAGENYRAGIAAHLASELSENAPCAVCGSTIHPMPAEHVTAAVTFEEFQAHQQDSVRAHQELDDAKRILDKRDEEIEHLQERIKSTPEEDTRARKQLEIWKANLEERTEAARLADVRLPELRDQEKKVAFEISEITKDIALKQQQVDAESEIVEALSVQLDEARGSFRDVHQRLQAIKSLVAAMESLIGALEAVDVAQRKGEAAQTNLAAFGVREGFGDQQAAQQYWDEAKGKDNEATSEFLRTQGELKQFDERVSALDDLISKRAELVEGDRDLQILAETFNPSRGNDYGLHIYVLRTKFDTVMALANRRLEALLNGRYRLIKEDDIGGDGRKLHGLDVAVEDALTGKVRSAKSLSGGESFCASLALALGLSDAVQSNAGGIRIDSLFIDEGFGSLDSSQLDEVMNMLNHLSSHGRRVGLISHVDSMKEAVIERINVLAARRDRPTSLTVSWMSE